MGTARIECRDNGVPMSYLDCANRCVLYPVKSYWNLYVWASEGVVEVKVRVRTEEGRLCVEVHRLAKHEDPSNFV